MNENKTFRVTLKNTQTGSNPTYISEAPSLEACVDFEVGVIERLQKSRPHIVLVSVIEVANEPALAR